jgi:hypothetical protein
MIRPTLRERPLRSRVMWKGQCWTGIPTEMKMPNQAIEQTRDTFLRHRSPTSAGRGATGAITQFPGAKWPAVKNPKRQQYLKNAYRVLLTRARQGMVIFVRPGAKRDRTRNPEFYEGIFDYLTGMGVAEF